MSSATLRRWSDAFSEHLSPTAGKSLTDQGGSVQRRYTDHDVLILTRVKQLLDEGNTYEEADRKLQDAPGLTETLPAVTTLTEPLMSVSASVVTAYEQALVSKDETIRSQQETIRTQQELIAELRMRPLPQAVIVSPEPVGWWERLDVWVKRRMIGAQ